MSRKKGHREARDHREAAGVSPIEHIEHLEYLEKRWIDLARKRRLMLGKKDEQATRERFSFGAPWPTDDCRAAPHDAAPRRTTPRPRREA
ncbi:hypothetical protein T492DRAFT_891157 [Pavlovales sp. CCMP2436]|nr:hypothetical protein T492DRAFT_891157 [Pavlovales sp. CCMP2436]